MPAGCIDHCTDSDGDPAEAHNIRTQPQPFHGNEGDQDADRQHDDGTSALRTCSRTMMVTKATTMLYDHEAYASGELARMIEDAQLVPSGFSL